MFKYNFNLYSVIYLININVSVIDTLWLLVVTLSFAFWSLSDSVSGSLETKRPLKGW